MARGPSKTRKASGPQIKEDPERLSFPLQEKHLPELNNQLRTLHQVFVLAGKKYNNGDNNGREGALIALTGAFIYLMNFELFQTELGPLQAVISGLQALNENGHPLLMQPKIASGQTVGSPLRKQLEAVSVYAVERLQSLGMSLDKACSLVAEELVSAGIMNTRSGAPISGRTVRNWKQRISEDVKDQSYRNRFIALMRTAGMELDTEGFNTPADILEMVELLAKTYPAGDYV